MNDRFVENNFWNSFYYGEVYSKNNRKKWFYFFSKCIETTYLVNKKTLDQLVITNCEVQILVSKILV